MPQLDESQPGADAAPVDASDHHWWGPAEIPVDSERRWRIGPLDLRVARGDESWRVAYRWDGDPMSDEVDRPEPTRIEPASPGFMAMHIAQTDGVAIVEVTPVSADRPVVSRPEAPIHLLAGDAVQVYIGAPIWARLTLRDPARVAADIPIAEAGDTWFGAADKTGELAYRSRTAARASADQVLRRPGRSVTPLRIENHTTERVVVERINLPCPRLSLYSDASGRLWTERLTMRIDEAGAQVVFGEPPDFLGPVEQVTAPRVPRESNLLTTLLSRLLG